MNARIEAAAKAHYEIGIGLWELTHKDTREVVREDMHAALEAADAVMFGEEAVERAAGAILSSKILPGWFPPNAAADLARAVLAALRDVPGGAVGAGWAHGAHEPASDTRGPENGTDGLGA